jgi:hypothetical protein
MNVEQRLTAAFRQVDRLEPSPDLWSRVVHSIDEDRRHRRRVLATIAAIVATAAVLVGISAASLVDGPFGLYVRRPVLELLEAVALVALAVALGPAIRRFGRGFAADLWPVGVSTPASLLRLLDVAYYLVLAGFILLSTQFDFAAAGTTNLLADQVADAVHRVGGLLLLLGLLHAATLLVLPVVALIDNSTRAGRPLPRWIVIALIVGGTGGALLVVPFLIGAVLAGTT